MSESDGVHNEINKWVEKGERDPLRIARKTIETRGQFWVAEQLLAMSEDILADMAREAINRVRRSAEVALRPDDAVATVVMKKAKVWVPTKGYIQADEVTVEDAALKSKWYAQAAVQFQRRAHWWSTVHDLMIAEGVRTLGSLSVNLPSLPDDDELDMPVIALARARELTA